MKLRVVRDFNIKTVDMTSATWDSILVESLKNTGFAVLKNHEVDMTALERLYKQWEQFFNDEKKHSYKKDANMGYIPFGKEKAKDSSVEDLKEFFHLASPFNEVPEGVSSEDSLKVVEGMEKIARHILFVLQPHVPKEMAAIHQITLHSSVKGSPKNLLRILHYPAISSAKEGAVRAAAHEDINLITILPAATQPGLEVKDLDGKWHKVECDPGTLIVNVGDMLQEATGGVFKSTTHRVVNPEGSQNVSRYSMPFFAHPKSETRLSKRYTAGEYLNQRLKEIGLIGEEDQDEKKDD